MPSHRFTLSFDLDNTLWDVDSIIIKAEQQMRQWLAEHTPEAHAAYQPDNLQRLRERVVQDHPHAITDLSFMRIQLLFELMQECGYGVRESRHNAEQAFDVFFAGRNTIEFYPGALDTLHTLAESYRLLALTNGNADINRAGLGDLFDGAVNSAEAGAKKPDPKIYHHFLDKFQLNKSHVVHIGDNLVDDIQGAHNVGLRSIWVNLQGHAPGPEDAQPHAEVTELNQLIVLVDELANR